MEDDGKVCPSCGTSVVVGTGPAARIEDPDESPNVNGQREAPGIAVMTTLRETEPALAMSLDAEMDSESSKRADRRVRLLASMVLLVLTGATVALVLVNSGKAPLSGSAKAGSVGAVPPVTSATSAPQQATSTTVAPTTTTTPVLAPPPPSAATLGGELVTAGVCSGYTSGPPGGTLTGDGYCFADTPSENYSIGIFTYDNPRDTSRRALRDASAGTTGDHDTIVGDPKSDFEVNVTAGPEASTLVRKIIATIGGAIVAYPINPPTSATATSTTVAPSAATSTTTTTTATVPTSINTSQPRITNESLPTAMVGVPYSATLAEVGCVQPSWQQTAVNELASYGLTLNSATGIISGTPTTAGSSQFYFEVWNYGNFGDVCAYKRLPLTISPA
ncbi:MAG TPA: putative Ig domain-containing protein [Acidimicrobiales bacterium]